MTDAGKMSLKLVKKEGIMLRNEWEERGSFPGKIPGEPLEKQERV
jgi:hypothetical protein